MGFGVGVSLFKTKRSLVTFVSLEKAVAKMATGWFRVVKIDIFALDK